MAAYSGLGNFPYWMTIQGDGIHATPKAVSEQISAVAASQYQFQVVLGASITYASGAEIFVTWYTSTGSVISSTSPVTSGSMTSGLYYQLTTGLITAPATTSYAICTVEVLGTPSASEFINVYQAEMDNASAQALNVNFAFSYTFWPWTASGTGAQLGWDYSPLLSGDSDSLTLAGQIELMGGIQGVQCLVPSLLDSNGQGPTFRVLAPPSLNSAAYGYEASYDFNAPQPTQDVVASMLLDGERPFGDRASNRTISLPIIIFGTMAGGMAQVLKAREYLMSIIDQQVWQTKWTSSDTGLALLFDCFRALPSTPLYGFNYSAGGTATGSTLGKANYPIGLITLSIQALPYGRSDIDGIQNLSFSNAISGGISPGTTSAATLDTFNTVFSPPPVITTPTWTNLGASTQTASATATMTTGTAVAAGNTIVVEVMTSANNITGIADAEGNVYTLAALKQVGGNALYGSLWTAPVVNPLGSADHIVVTAGGSQNWQAKAYVVQGGWTPASAVVSNTGTTASFSTTISGLTQYDLTLSFSFGAASSGVNPTGWTGINNPSGNGWNATLAYYSEPINATTAAFAIASGLPNPYSVLVVPLVPVNQYWNYDGTTPPPGYVGHSAHYQSPRPMNMPWPAATYTHTLATAANIAGCPVLSVQFGQSYDTQWPAAPTFASNVTLWWTLTDNLGRTLKFNKTVNSVQWGSNPTSPKWTQINSPIPQGQTFNYNGVVSYTVRIANWSGSGHTGYVRMHCWLNDITANPQTIQNTVSPRGSLYNLFSLAGTARSPINVQCQMPASAQISKELTTPLSGNFIVPAGVYSLYAETWAAGGAGASLNLSRAIAGGGGGAGEYAAEPVLNVTPGQQIPYLIGSGGLPGQLANTVIQFTNPGLAHWTCPVGVTSVYMETWGGGAAGPAGGGGGGGGGYSGHNIAVTAGVTYYVWVAAGGKANTGTTSAQNQARVGGNSYVSNNPAATYATSIIAASGGNTALTGSSSGGHAGDNTNAPSATVMFWGGRGGASPGAAGGGGGGAGGATGAGGVGADSPASSTLGRYLQGGPGGTGTGQGGNGGAGANAPGFPSAGAQPGGGGGGGYTSTTLATASNPSNTNPGTQNVNFLGANGGAGMVQFTYAIGGGSPINGGNTTFGTSGTTGTIVTAHGGTSAPNNSAAGGLGGTGSANTVHNNGGAGGLVLNPTFGSYMVAPQVTNVFTTLGTMTYNAAQGTSSASSASVAQGVAIALISSTADVSDLIVTDSAGNYYQLTGGVQQAGSGGNGVTAYAYVSNIEYPVTTSTTLTVSSATSQQYGVLWYASPWLAGGVTTGNSGTGKGTGTAVSGTFGAADTNSIEIQLAMVLNDGNESATLPNFQGRVWYNAGSTSTLAAGSMTMAAYVMENQGGGTGVSGGDVFSATLAGSANWAVLCIPLTLANQQGGVVKLDWRTGSTPPGAQTTWDCEANIPADGMIVVIGACGSGSTITAGPSAIADAAGNTYTLRKNQAIPSNGGAVFVWTAPVTHPVSAGTAGTYNWGAASAAPVYAVSTYWIPNASGVDGVSAVTGSSTTIAGSYTPTVSNDVVLSIPAYAAAAAPAFSATVTGWNQLDANSGTYLYNKPYMIQAVDEAAVSASYTLGTSTPWVHIAIGMTMQLAGTGGGAAGGPGNAGYPGLWEGGGPGFAGGGSGKGGNGAGNLNSGGGGAALPGGGGGGAFSNNTSSDAGGQGGNGMVRLTWTPPLTSFNTLIIHSLGMNTDPNVNPIVPVPITDVPNNTEYSVPSIGGLRPATFASTYTVMLCNYSWNSATVGAARQVTLTVNQYEYPGGPKYSVQVTKAITPATDIVNGLVDMGEVTLPIKDYIKWNDQSYFTLSINDTDTTDRFMDVLFLDTTGQTVLINIDPGQPGYGQYVNYFIDEPTTDRDLGFCGASMQDRQHSVSVIDYAELSGGPLYIAPGDNLFMVYSTTGAPDLAVNYAPRWYLDRTL